MWFTFIQELCAIFLLLTTVASITQTRSPFIHIFIHICYFRYDGYCDELDFRYYFTCVMALDKRFIVPSVSSSL